MKAIWNKSGNNMVDEKGPYDDIIPLSCPSCQDRRYTTTRYCKGCDSQTDYITCKACGEKTVEANVCDDCGYLWLD